MQKIFRCSSHPRLTWQTARQQGRAPRRPKCDWENVKWWVAWRLMPWKRGSRKKRTEMTRNNRHGSALQNAGRLLRAAFSHAVGCSGAGAVRSDNAPWRTGFWQTIRPPTLQSSQHECNVRVEVAGVHFSYLAGLKFTFHTLPSSRENVSAVLLREKLLIFHLVRQGLGKFSRAALGAYFVNSNSLFDLIALFTFRSLLLSISTPLMIVYLTFILMLLPAQTQV